MEDRKWTRRRDILIVAAFVLLVAGLVLAGRGSDSSAGWFGYAPGDRPSCDLSGIPGVATVRWVELDEAEQSLAYETDTGELESVPLCDTTSAFDEEGAEIGLEQIRPGALVQLTFSGNGSLKSVEVIEPGR